MSSDSSDLSPDSPNRDLLARLRHDLRTPINHILGYSELLAEELADAGNGAYDADLHKVRAAAHSLLGLINAHLSPEGLQSLINGETGAESTLTPSAVPAITAATAPAADFEAPAVIAGRILVVDDNADNRQTLCRRLERQGHTTAQAGDGRAALDLLRQTPFDLVLLDVIMPELDGTAALREMKADPALREIPVIMISALDELGSVVRCIETGAEDYLAKPFNPTLLRARIGASLEKKALRDLERHHLHTIETTQARLNQELEEAANYVCSILPPPDPDPPVRIDWRFVPSTELGGDSFGYYWLDDENLVFYLLDVCGHGVGAALLSVAAANLLRTANSHGIDYRDPSAVLSMLNELFPMEKHNNMYFTIWYGVYHAPSRTLTHASGGHPPAFFLKPDGTLEKLREPGLVVGVMSGIQYNSASLHMPEGSRLFVLSDGTYEIRQQEGMLPFEEFESFFHQHGREPDFLARLTQWTAELNGPGPLCDDFSIIQLDF